MYGEDIEVLSVSVIPTAKIRDDEDIEVLNVSVIPSAKIRDDEDIEVLNASVIPSAEIRDDEDIKVLNVSVIPTTKIRDDYAQAGLSTTEQSKLFLLGFAITAVLILAVVLYLQLRLRQQYSLYEKDKVQMSARSKVLHNILNKVLNNIPSSSEEIRSWRSIEEEVCWGVIVVMRRSKREREREWGRGDDDYE